MPDLSNPIQIIQNIVDSLSTSAPPWFLPALRWILFIAFLAYSISWVIARASEVKEAWIRHIWPWFYNSDDRRRSRRRRRFAAYIQREIQQIGLQEEWRDYRFAELEVEVEAEGRHRSAFLYPILPQRRSRLRREKSLSKAIISSTEPIVLVEGDPGSGKSVALRHVAERMAETATKSRSTKSLIPIYVNLRDLHREEDQPVDVALIRWFALRSLTRINDRDVDMFLDDEFDTGLAEGTWLFLFDSFDEIPEILSSTDGDSIITTYGQAISDFLLGMKSCRGIIASREFRGPGRFGWPRFRIMPLSERRKKELMHKADMTRREEREISVQLAVAGEELKVFSSNPLFLALLCDHIRDGHGFPTSAHAVFESYVNTRLHRDEARVHKRFGCTSREIRSAAEAVAFCMTADTSLSLSAERTRLEVALTRNGFDIGKQLNMLLDALEYIKLARSDPRRTSADPKVFTFAHRRFQEYFATCTVLAEPYRVSPRQLLLDARWRETAVVLFQTREANALPSMFDEADRLLSEINNAIHPVASSTMSGNSPAENTQSYAEKMLVFRWPVGTLHLLGLLQAGLGSRLSDIPDSIRSSAYNILLEGARRGDLLDMKWAVDVAGILREHRLVILVATAFARRSHVVREAAFLQVSRLANIPDEIGVGIRRSLIDLFTSGRLIKERQVTWVQLSRLPNPGSYISALNLLVWLPAMDVCLYAASIALFGIASAQAPRMKLITVPFSLIAIVLFISFICFYADLRIESMGFVRMKQFVTLLRQYPVYLLLIPFIFTVADFGHLPPVGYVVLPLLANAITLYASSFAPSAIKAVELERYTRMSQWYLIPLIGLINFARSPLSGARAFLQAVSNKAVRKVLLILVVFLLAVFGVIGGLLWVWFALVRQYLPWLFPFGSVLVTIPILIGLLYGPSATIYELLRDRLAWRRWTRLKHGTISCQDMCTAVLSFRTLTFRVKVLRRAREQRLLAATRDNEEILSAMTVLAKYAGRGNTFESSASDSVAVAHLKAQPMCFSVASNAQWELLDCIVLILQDMRAALAPEDASSDYT